MFVGYLWCEYEPPKEPEQILPVQQEAQYVPQLSKQIELKIKQHQESKFSQRHMRDLKNIRYKNELRKLLEVHGITYDNTRLGVINTR